MDDALRLNVWEVVRSLDGQPTGIGSVTWARGRSWRTSTTAGASLPLRLGTLTLHEQYGALQPECVIHLVSVPQRPFGGIAHWLQCMKCGTLRRALFLWSGRTLRCRVCERLAYPSQRLTRRKRAAYAKVKTGRRILGYWDDPASPPPRPKGMHARTYGRLLAQWRAWDRKTPRSRRVADTNQYSH